jgi:hypothetical protein
MKKNMTTIIILAGLLFLPAYGFATDYSRYTLEELSQMRGTMQNASDEDRSAFRDAWRAKMQNASAEDRQSMRGNGRKQGNRYGNDSGKGYGMENGGGRCDGSGKGHGRGKRR